MKIGALHDSDVYTVVVVVRVWYVYTWGYDLHVVLMTGGGGGTLWPLKCFCGREGVSNATAGMQQSGIRVPYSQ